MRTSNGIINPLRENYSRRWRKARLRDQRKNMNRVVLAMSIELERRKVKALTEKYKQES